MSNQHHHGGGVCLKVHNIDGRQTVLPTSHIVVRQGRIESFLLLEYKYDKNVHNVL